VFDLIDLTKLHGAKILDIQSGPSSTDSGGTNLVVNHQYPPVLALYKEYEPKRNEDDGEPLNKVVLFFNGNNCDVSTTLWDMNHIMRYTKCSVIALGYPRYDLSQAVIKHHTKYNGTKWRNNNILAQMDDTLKHGRQLLDYLLDVVGLESEDIIPVGFSIGTGVACHLANYLYESRRSRFALISLHSPFSSLAKTIGEKAASISGLMRAKAFEEAIKSGNSDTFDRWNSLENLRSIDPVPNLLLFHNPLDNTVPFSSGSLKMVRELTLDKNCYLFDNMAVGDGAKHGLLVSSREIKLFAEGFLKLRSVTQDITLNVNELLRNNLACIVITNGFKSLANNEPRHSIYLPGKPLISPVMLSDCEL